MGIVDGKYLRGHWRRDSVTGSPCSIQNKKRKAVALAVP